MSKNGEESTEQRKERALYQHGEKVATDARHRIQGPTIKEESYVPSDVMSAMFYIHQNTIANVASQIAEDCEDLSEEDLDTVTKAIDKVRGSFVKQKDSSNE